MDLCIDVGGDVREGHVQDWQHTYHGPFPSEPVLVPATAPEDRGHWWSVREDDGADVVEEKEEKVESGDDSGMGWGHARKLRHRSFT